MKGWVVKWQRALVTPFRSAAALEAVPLQLVSTLLIGKQNSITWERYIHMKKETVYTRLTHFFNTSGRVNLHDDFFQTKSSSCKPVKNSQTSLKTPRKLF